jgi:hypothetical protein
LDAEEVRNRIKVKFSQERGLKAGRFFDPNALYIKMFEKQAKKEAEAKRQAEELAKGGAAAGVGK